jgi:hypothetical protein
MQAWSTKLAAMVAEEQLLRARGHWIRGRDDFFGILRIHRRETLHCAMIAWLLDPLGRHGLGTSFLGGFLRVALGDRPFDDLAKAMVQCEVVRPDSRADIVIWLPAATIVVEAKVDAEEGDDQCGRLQRDFENDGAFFLLLAPELRRPRDVAGAPATKFESITFGAVREALRLALRAPASHASHSGRPLADDYLRTLEREFP